MNKATPSLPPKGGRETLSDPALILLLFLVSVVPVILWPGFFVVFSLAKLVVLQVVVAIALIYVALSRGRDGLSVVRGLDHLLIVFFALVVAATIFSGNSVALFGRYGRYDGLITYASYLAVFVFAARVRWSADRYRVLFLTLAAGAVLVAAYGLLQGVGLDVMRWSEVRFEARRAFSTFGNPILLATYLATLLPICAALTLETDARRRRLGFVASALVAGALVLTFTRAGWIAGLTGLGVFFALRQDWKRLLTVVVAGLVALTLAATILAVLLPGNEFSRAITERRGSVRERAEVWRIGARAALARPLFGFGPDNFQAAFSPQDTPARSAIGQGDTLIDNAHNYPIQLAVTAGIPAALVFFSWVLWLLWRTLARAAPEDEDHYIHGLGAALIAYLTSLLFTVNTVGSGVVFWILLGVLRGRLAGASETLADRSGGDLIVSAGPVVRRWKAWRANTATRLVIAIPVLVLAVGLLGLSVTQAMADSTYLAAKKANQAGRNQEALLLFERAIRLNPFVDNYRQDYGRLYLDKAIFTNDRADYKRAISIFAGARALALGSSDAWMLLGQAHLYYGRAHEPRHLKIARDHLERSVELWPQGAANHYLLGETNIALGEPASAVVWLERALDIKSDFPEAEAALEATRRQPAEQ